MLRGIAGIMVLISLGLAYAHSPNWFILTAFIGLNLLQSAFTNWCPMMSVLRRSGINGTKKEGGIQ